MHSVIRMTAIYLFLLVVLRFSGKRTFSQITTFDFVLLLIVSEATQQAILGDDFSVTNAFVAIGTLVFLDMVFTKMKSRWNSFEAWSEGVPLVLVEDGKPIEERLRRTRVGVDDIMQVARTSQGLERLEQVKWAVLERSGGISIVPK